jgi:organic hydroperoxide reductase OsmC/OhrA
MIIFVPSIIEGGFKMPAPFPHLYRSDLTWRKDREGVLTATGQPPIIGGPPPQFDGSDAYWSPEELLLSSVQLCLMTTFFALLAKTAYAVERYSSEAQGRLEKTKDGIRFTEIQVTVALKSGDKSAVDELLLKAKKYCIISNTLNLAVDLKMKE